MSEWWTYRLSDFLMFAPGTYYRLFELYNAAVWPLHVAALALGLGLPWLVLRGGAARSRIACALLAPVWLFVAWAYHWERYATINWGAEYYAAGFAIQGLLLGIAAAFGPSLARPSRLGGGLAILLLVVGIGLYPLVAPLTGRPWTQAELFGLAPDPTAVATLGVLVLAGGRAAWVLLPLPLLWCAVTAATLWTMESPEAPVPLIAALLAVVALVTQKAIGGSSSLDPAGHTLSR